MQLTSQSGGSRVRDRLRRVLPIAVAAAIWTPAGAYAYSSFGDYVRPIEEGGGGGRLFSGTPADGYGCEVCHRGATGAELEVLGLPLDGYVPGRAYEILLRWPETTPHVAVMAELTDLVGLPAGVTALAPYASWQPGELCEESGFPAADVCRAGAASGCCRELDPSRDACSFPGERTAFWLLDCGSRFARLVWTAPAGGDVWFSAEMVTSNLQNDAEGDGVTGVRERLRPLGTSPEVVTALGGCQLQPDADLTRDAWALLASFGALCCAVRRRRSAARSRSM